MKHRDIGIAAIVCTLALILAGCGSAAHSSTGTSTSSKPAPGKKISIGVVTALNSIAFSQTVGCGAEAAGKKLGVDVSVQGPSQFSPQQQIPVLQATARSGVQGIIIDPTDSSALIAPLQQIQHQGTTVITNDINLNRPIATAQFTTSNVRGGQLAAQYLGKSTSGHGKVLVISWDPGVSTSNDRINGFAKGLKTFPGLSELPVQYAHNESNVAAQITEAAVRSTPDLIGIFATNDGVASGVATGLKDTGMSGKIKLVAYDADPQEVQQLKSGAFDALIAQAAYQEGYDAVTLMTRILRGDIKKSAVQFNNLVPDAVITRKNINSPASQKLIYKTSC